MNNEACKGYLIKACKYARANKKVLEELLESLEWAFDEMTEGEAEEYYKNYNQDFR